MCIDYLDSDQLKVKTQAFADHLFQELQAKPLTSWKGTELDYWLCDLDDYVPVLPWLDRVEAFATVLVHQLSRLEAKQKLPLHRGNVYLWRCDEYINGLGRLISWGVRRDELFIALRAALSTLLQWFCKNGEYSSIYYPQLGFRLPIAYSQGGVTLEALWNILPDVDEFIPKLTEKIRSTVLHALDFWSRSPYFVEHGLFPNKDGLLLRGLSFLPEPIRDRPFVDASASVYDVPATYQAYLGLILAMKDAFRKSTTANIMNDNTSLAFCFLRVAEAFPANYELIAKKWLLKLSQSRCEGLTPMYWHPVRGGSRPRLVACFTHINALLYYYWFIRSDSRMLDWAVQIGEAVLKHLKMPNGLLAEEPERRETYFDSQTDTCVSFCKLYEATGEQRWYKEALDLTRNARKYHQTASGYVLSVNEQGNIVHPAISPRFNFLHVKSQIAIENVGQIKEDRKLFELLEDR